MKLSVIIPSTRDPYLYKTVESLLQGDVEVIPVLDGWVTELPNDPRVKPILLEKSKGMRGATNEGIKISKGDFIMKSDSHCLYAPDYMRMIEDSEEDWLMIPRRYSLDYVNWKREESRPINDYHFLSFPSEGHYGYDMAVLPDKYRSRQLAHIPIDDTMIFQGSCWMANKKYFMKHIGLMDDRPETYGSFACEPAEIGLKYWLGGGQVKVDKNTWYAHLRKGKEHYATNTFSVNYKRGKQAMSGHTWATDHWLHDREPGMIHKFEWLLEKFWPVPTWSENWKDLI